MAQCRDAVAGASSELRVASHIRMFTHSGGFIPTPGRIDRRLSFLTASSKDQSNDYSLPRAPFHRLDDGHLPPRAFARRRRFRAVGLCARFAPNAASPVGARVDLSTLDRARLLLHPVCHRGRRCDHPLHPLLAPFVIDVAAATSNTIPTANKRVPDAERAPVHVVDCVCRARRNSLSCQISTSCSTPSAVCPTSRRNAAYPTLALRRSREAAALT